MLTVRQENKKLCGKCLSEASTWSSQQPEKEMGPLKDSKHMEIDYHKRNADT